tara:strand:+ start:17106 stop:17423 length:318 start_codon:yes stop_codon:yes gene_type:complete
MSKSEKSKNSLHGKPWATHSKHKEYSSAALEKEGLEKNEDLQVKIRRYSDDTFQVKTRSTVTPKKEPVQKEVSASAAKKKDGKPKTRAQRRAEKMRRKAQQEKKN